MDKETDIILHSLTRSLYSQIWVWRQIWGEDRYLLSWKRKLDFKWNHDFYEITKSHYRGINVLKVTLQIYTQLCSLYNFTICLRYLIGAFLSQAPHDLTSNNKITQTFWTSWHWYKLSVTATIYWMTRNKILDKWNMEENKHFFNFQKKCLLSTVKLWDS